MKGEKNEKKNCKVFSSFVFNFLLRDEMLHYGILIRGKLNYKSLLLFLNLAFKIIH